MANTEPVSIESLDQRQIFASIDEAWPIFEAYQKASGPNVEFVVQGASTNAEGEYEIDEKLFNPEKYQTLLYRMSQMRDVTEVDEEGKTITKRKGVTVLVGLAPIPRLDILMTSDEGKGYVMDVLLTEFNHRIARPFREEKSNFAAVLIESPHTIEQFIEGTRKDGAGSLITAFNEAFKQLNPALKAKSADYKRAKITKADLRAAMNCTAFAEYRFPHLEEAGLFVMINKVFAGWSEKNGHNATIFANWQESRDSIAYAIPTAESTDSLLDDLLAGFGDDAPADEAEEVAPEGEAVEAEEDVHGEPEQGPEAEASN